MAFWSDLRGRLAEHVWLQVVGLVVAVLLVFGQGLMLGFLSDDFDLMAGATSPSFHLLDPFPAGSGQYWRPLVLLSLRWLETWIGGPTVQHAFNILLHLANGLLVFTLVRRDHQSFLAWLVALGFSVHVAQVTDVFWISGRTDLLSSFFVLLGLLGMQRYAQGDRRAYMLVTWLCLVAALMAKELAVVMPLMALAYLPAWAENRLTLRSVGTMLLGMIILVTVFVVYVRATFYGQELPGISLGRIPGNLLRQGFFMVAPIPAPFAKSEPLLASLALLPFVAILTWIAVLILRQRSSLARLLGLLAAPGLAMAPTLLFLDGTDARLMYLPLALVAVSLPYLIPKPDKFLLSALSLGVLVMMAASLNQGRIWRANQVLADTCAREFVDLVSRDEPQRLYVFMSAPAVREHVPVFANDLNRHLYHALTGDFGAFPDFGYVGLLVYSEPIAPVQENDWTERIFRRSLPDYSESHFNLGRGVKAPRVFQWATGTATVAVTPQPGHITKLTFQVDPRFANHELWVFDFNGKGFQLKRSPTGPRGRGAEL